MFTLIDISIMRYATICLMVLYIISIIKVTIATRNLKYTSLLRVWVVILGFLIGVGGYHTSWNNDLSTDQHISQVYTLHPNIEAVCVSYTPYIRDNSANTYIDTLINPYNVLLLSKGTRSPPFQV